MGRRPCCSKEGFNRGAWTAVEDKILRDYIKIHGEGRWRDLPKKAGLKRCGKSCRLRWLNYLRPDIKRGNITQDEEELIIRLHKLLGNRWSLIAGRLPGRTDNEIKNYWNTNLGKKVEGHPSSTLIKKSNQSKEKKKKKNPPMIRPSLEAPPPPKMQSNVVRTKALRCTKVFLTPQASQVEHLDSKMTVVPSTVEGDFVTQKEIKPETYEGGLLSFTPGTDDSSDFLMDFNVGELCLSDLLDFDFSQLGHFDNGIGGEGNENDNSDLSPCSDQAPLYPEEMLEFWTGGDGIQSDIVSDLRSLASFQDGEEDWL